MSPSRLLRAAACVLALAAGPAAAQVNGGFDLDFGNDCIWRGITRASSYTLRPQAWISVPTADGELALGAWTAIELGDVEPTEITARGRHHRAPAEFDVWAQYTHHLPGVDAAVGAIRYTFTGDPDGGGLGDDASTTEVYAQLWPTFLPALEPKVTLYHDVERTRGTWLEVDATHAFPIFPLAPTDLLVGATGGFSLREPRDFATARGWESFAGTGVTHVDLRAGLAVRLVDLLPVPLAAHFTLHHQRSYDDATRAYRVGESRSNFWWGEGGLSVTLGRERRPR